MAITLAEAKVGMADKVDQQIVDMFRRSSLLLDNMVFDNVISPGTGGSTLTYGYIQLKTPSTAGAGGNGVIEHHIVQQQGAAAEHIHDLLIYLVGHADLCFCKSNSHNFLLPFKFFP